MRRQAQIPLKFVQEGKNNEYLEMSGVRFVYAASGKVLELCPGAHVRYGTQRLCQPASRQSEARQESGRQRRDDACQKAVSGCGTLCAAVAGAGKSGGAGGVLLDAGCGEGYYTEGVSRALEQAALPMQVYGVDISKSAADAAAKRCPGGHFAVGSVYHLPVADRCCDMLMTIFAPYCGEE